MRFAERTCKYIYWQLDIKLFFDIAKWLLS